MMLSSVVLIGNKVVLRSQFLESLVQCCRPCSSSQYGWDAYLRLMMKGLKNLSMFTVWNVKNLSIPSDVIHCFISVSLRYAGEWHSVQTLPCWLFLCQRLLYWGLSAPQKLLKLGLEDIKMGHVHLRQRVCHSGQDSHTGVLPTSHFVPQWWENPQTGNNDLVW